MTSTILDEESQIRSIDTDDMLGSTMEFASHWERVFDKARSEVKDGKLPNFRQIDNVILCGMGGSAIAGDLLRSYLRYRSVIPFEVVRNYRLPGYASPHTLVIISSYSGETEETISAYKEALARNCRIYTISNGSERDVVKRMALENGHGHFDVPQGYAPRAALAFSFVPLLVFFDRWELAPPQDKAIEETIRVLDQCIADYGRDSPTDANDAKKIAQQLQGKLPIIYAGVDHIAPVAARWQTQINENSKMLAHVNILPEMNHNESLGWPVRKDSIGEKFLVKKPRLYPSGEPVKPQEDLVDLVSVLYLLDRPPDEHKRTRYRFKVMEPVIQTCGVQIQKIESRGEGLLARMFSLISLGDFVSVYLAVLNEIDPTSVATINYVKEKMAAFKDDCTFPR